ncbi:hypothetical protein [Streptomyces diastatochromogenes]|uniref:hypothetical protein n=1 Tax=Streptomyces diastatochromogenes TaxID=42236 RepID=UPI00368E44EA
MPESAQTQALVVLDPAHVPAARELAAAHGVELHEVPRRGVEPVTTVTLVLMGAATAVGALQHALEQRKGGQVIDLRPGAPRTLYRTPDVVYGTVVVLAADGTVTVEVKEPDGMFGKVISVLPNLLSAGGNGTEQVSATVTATFGADVEVRPAAGRPARDGEA